MFAPFIKFSKDECGSAIIETAFVLPVLILLGYGAVDFSNLLISHHKMQTSLTSAGSYLARTPNPQSYEAQARNLAVTGQISGGQTLLDGWTPQSVTIAYRNTDNSGGLYRGDSIVESVSLSTSLSYQGFGFVNALVPGSVTLRDSYEARIIKAGA